MPIIEVNHLTKEYNLGAITSIKDTLRHGISRLMGNQTWEREKFKALDDIDFSIEEGEVVGIIGHNGAGKSTLLKHLAHITTPTSGKVIINGSVAPLIEVGAGVNPELSGRENIYLNGSILGIPKKIIDKKLDEIIEFSELEQFIDTPVKRYSSGMTVKLGFSIATSMDADILIIDEVLAVGDLAFQRKCFDRMESLIKRKGKTVLLVSHNLRQIQRLCNRVIVLNKGKIHTDSTPEEACNVFYDLSNKAVAKNIRKDKRAGDQSTGEAIIDSITLLDENDNPVDEFEYHKPFTIQIDFTLTSPLSMPTFGVGIHTTDFLYLATHNSEEQISIESMDKGPHTVKCKITDLPLLPGVYSLRLGITDGHSARTVYYGENVKHFIIAENKQLQIPITQREGFFTLNAKWDANG
jgi:ABC-type polysaccharide/polyol phosphate transport system ATPase subunit